MPLPHPVPAPVTLPLDLPRLIMRRAVAVGLVTLLLATGLGLWRVGHDIDNEVDAAMTLASLMARLGHLEQTDDTSALDSLRAMQSGEGLRHLALHIRAADGRVLLAPPEPETDNPVMEALFALHRRWLSAPDARQVSWPVARPSGGAWTVSLTASHEGERREALTNLLGTLTLLIGTLAGLLLVLRWNVQHAFRPLAGLLGAIDGIERHDAGAVRTLLPLMPIRELEVIAAALRHLAEALEQAESRRRLLSQKVLTLQEDERTRLARELHDEFGQRLTALRFDAAWLQRRLQAQPEPPADLLQVVQGMTERCAEVQHDIRSLLQQLDPIGPAADAGNAPIPLARLLQLLDALVQSWHQGASPAHITLTLQQRQPDGTLQPLAPEPQAEPADSADPTDSADSAEPILLPRATALALYRLSQEALTNAARHAQARHVRLTLALEPGTALHWSVQDDGIGIPNPAAAMQHGNGLGGMQERVWALGGEWHWDTAPITGGLHLSARLPLSGAARAA